MEDTNVLIIEDNKESAKKLERFFEVMPYKYWIISNPKEVVNMVKTIPSAAVLTELRMPHMNGVEVTKAVLKNSPSTSVVVMTPPSFISFAIEAMEAGAYGYVSKPFNLSEIKIVLSRAVERYNMMVSYDKKEYYAGLSIKDGLTGIYNRRFLDIQLKAKIQVLQDQKLVQFSILLIDIDDFKKYNDTQGHVAGDSLLRDLGKLFGESLRGRDIAFRYGGEEFLILLDGASKQEASMVGERIRTTVNLYAPATISIGVATFPDDADNEIKLIEKADQALYKAKNSGKNKVCIA